MKSVSGEVESSEPIPLSKASKILSNFVSVHNGASEAVGVYLRRASTSFTELTQFQKDIKFHRKHRNENPEKKLGKIEGDGLRKREKKRNCQKIEDEGAFDLGEQLGLKKKNKKRRRRSLGND